MDSEEVWGEITEAALERLLERKDVERTTPGSYQRGFLMPSPWAEGELAKANFYISSEMNERLARGIGDMNPLFLDPAYARKSPWGRQITPPAMLSFAELSNGASDGFPGCHAIWRDVEYEWGAPVYTDEPCKVASYLTGAKLVDSRFAGGKAGIQEFETKVHNFEGELKGHYRTSWHRFSRKKAAKSSKYKSVERPQWTDEDLQKIWDEYRTQNLSCRRGSEILYYEDVKTDVEIPHLIKGPITLTSKLAFEFARGASGWFVGHELALDLFDKYPNLPIRNEENVPEPPIAIHWTNERCQKYLGMPGAYEAGYERLNWYLQMLMSWMGDHGWVKNLKLEFRGFHWQGDAVRIHGKIKEKRIEDGKGLVTLEIKTVSHRDEVTSLGEATVILPLKTEVL